jgi:hypothetical protein
MKSNIKTLHEFSPHIPHKPSKGNGSRPTNEMMHADISVSHNAMNESPLHTCHGRDKLLKIARPSTHSTAIGANRPRPVLRSEGVIVVMDRLNRRCAK